MKKGKPRAISLTKRAYEAARRRHEKRIATEPLAIAVRYTPARDSVIVDINNGSSIVIPRRLMQGLQNATLAQLRDAYVMDGGTYVSFEDVDAQFTVLGLLSGVFGSPRWMAELGRQGGSVRSPAKATAARINGAKGGRPRKRAKKARSTKRAA